MMPGVAIGAVDPSKPINSAMLMMSVGVHFKEKPVGILVLSLPRYFSVCPSTKVSVIFNKKNCFSPSRACLTFSGGQVMSPSSTCLLTAHCKL